MKQAPITSWPGRSRRSRLAFVTSSRQSPPSSSAGCIDDAVQATAGAIVRNFLLILIERQASDALQGLRPGRAGRGGPR